MPIHLITAPGVNAVVDENGVSHPVRASDNTAVFYGETTEALRAGCHKLGTAGSLKKPTTHSQ